MASKLSSAKSRPLIPLELAPANVGLDGGVGDRHDVDVARAGEVAGRGPRPAAEVQQAHPVRRLEQEVFGIVRMREPGAREYTGAVVVLLAPVRAKDVVVRSVFVVVLEEIIGPRHPLDELAPLELVQLAAYAGRVLRMGGEAEQDVVEGVVGYEQGDGDPGRRQQHPGTIHAWLP
jgi:hypothetical protein